MALKDWKKIRNENDYKVWENKKTKKRMAVYRNIFTSPGGRSYYKKNITQALKYAENHRKKN